MARDSINLFHLSHHRRCEAEERADRGSCCDYLVAAALPVPERLTLCGELGASSTIVRVPSCEMVLVGLKVTDTLQLLPGLRTFSHCDFIANCCGDALSIAILSGMLRLRPEFVIVTVLGLLVVATRTLLPNASVSGWIVSLLGYSPNTASWVCVPI